jgi:hypothetical protein
MLSVECGLRAMMTLLFAPKSPDRRSRMANAAIRNNNPERLGASIYSPDEVDLQWRLKPWIFVTAAITTQLHYSST